MILRLLVLIALPISFSGCSANCGSCDGADLLVIEGVAVVGAPVIIPTVLTGRLLARGPTAEIAQSEPNAIKLISSFDTDLNPANAAWADNEKLIIWSGVPDRYLSRLIDVKGKPIKPLDQALYGKPLGVVRNNILFAHDVGANPDNPHKDQVRTNLQLYDLYSGKISPLPGPPCIVNLLVGERPLSQDGHRLLCHSEEMDGMVVLDTNSGQIVRHLPNDPVPKSFEQDHPIAYGLAGDDGALIGTSKGTLETYPDNPIGKVREISTGSDRITRVVGIPKTNFVAAVIYGQHSNSRIIVIDTATGATHWQETLTDLSGSAFEIGLSTDDDGRLLAIKKSHEVELYDVASGRRIALLTTGERHQIQTASLNAAGDQLVVTASSRVTVFHLASPNPIPGKTSAN